MYIPCAQDRPTFRDSGRSCPGGSRSALDALPSSCCVCRTSFEVCSFGGVDVPFGRLSFKVAGSKSGLFLEWVMLLLPGCRTRMEYSVIVVCTVEDT